jgi:hypothetical protein
VAQSKSEKSWSVLQSLDVSQPTRTRTTPLDEPEIAPPPMPPVSGKLAKEKEAEPEVDPFEAAKEQYRVDLIEVFKWNITSDTEREHVKEARPMSYLIFDNYYDRVMVSGISGLELALQTGEEQIIYFWFYRKAYGFGYSACPMGQLELAHKLQWSRDRVKRHLASLVEKGHIKPLDEFPPFRNHRPQVYRVMLPREILRQKIDEIKEQERREAMMQAMAEFRKKFGDF